MTAPASLAHGETLAVRPCQPGGISSLSSYRNNVPPCVSNSSGLPTSSTLSRNTIVSAEQELSGFGCVSTMKMREGLVRLANAFAAMADYSLSSHHHLFSLDPGVGKTTMVKHFLTQLIGSTDHEEVSAIVFLSRLDEVEKLLRALMDRGLRGHVAVLVGKEEDERFAELVSTPPNEARVLITTQQMLTRRCRGGGRFSWSSPTEVVLRYV